MTSPGLNMWKLFPSLCSWLFSQVMMNIVTDSPGTPSHPSALYLCPDAAPVCKGRGMAGDGRGRKEKPKVYSPAPPAGCCGGFLPALARWSSPSSSLFCSSGPPITFAFSTGGVMTFLKPAACVTALVSAVSLHSRQPLYHLLDCLNESSFPCQDSDIQEF